MKEELAKKLTESYPHLYHRSSETRPPPFTLFGFECGDGWYGLLDEVSAKLEALIVQLPEGDCFADDAKDDCPPRRDNFYAAQVKEKFGSLRFYMSMETEEMSEAIRKAEEKSEETCMECGAEGEIRVERGWWYCSCESHKRT